MPYLCLRLPLLVASFLPLLQTPLQPYEACFTGRSAEDEVDIDAMSTDEAEVHEEVAEAVQAARKEGLRNDLLGMVCPSDWTIQAPEPLGTLNMPLFCTDAQVFACSCPSTCLKPIVTMFQQFWYLGQRPN